MSYIVDEQLTKTAFGELLVGQLTQKVQVRFNYSVNDRQTVETAVNTGSSAISNDQVSISTGVNSTGSLLLRSRDLIRYENGKGILGRFTAIFTVGVADNQQMIGLGSITDGFAFGYDDTTFGIFRFQNGTPTHTPQASWNVDTMVDGTGPSGQTLDHDTGNVYAIRFQHLGYGMIRFYIENSTTGKFQEVHNIAYANLNTSPSVFNPTFPIFAYVVNSGNTTDISLKTASWGGFIEGLESSTGIRNGIDNEKSGLVSETNVLTIRNKTTYQSKINRVPVKVDFIDIAADGSQTSKVRVYLNESLSGGSYTSIDVNTSVVEYDTAGTISGTAGYLLYPFGLGRAGSKTEGGHKFEVLLNPGDILTVTGQSTSPGSDIFVGLSWLEQF